MSDETSDDLASRLDRWVAEGLLTRPQADAIAAYEAGSPAGARGGKGRTAVPISEALGYLGAALAAAAFAVVLGRAWDGVPTLGRVGVPAVLWFALLVGGWALRDATDAARIRLGRVLWFLSTSSLAWAAWEVTWRLFDASNDRWPLIVSGVVAGAQAFVLYTARPSSMLQVSLALASVLAIAGAFYDEGRLIALGLWALGIAWIVLAWGRALRERSTGLTLGSLGVMLGGLLFPIGIEGAAEWSSLVSAALLVGLSVATAHTPMLVIGALGLFQAVFATVQHYLGGTTGAAVGLLVAGLVILAVAAVSARLRRRREGREA